MRLTDYPTPAQTSIFIGSTHIDDATRVQFEVQHPKIPLYGYNNSVFRVVADGKILITGNIVINYRMPGYLLQAINNYRQFEKMRDLGTKLQWASSQEDSPKLDRPQMLQLLREMRSDQDGVGTGSTKRLKRLVKALKDGTFREVSALMQTMMVRRVFETNADWYSSHHNPAMGRASDVAFDLQVAYGDNYGPTRVDTLERCYITGMGKAMSASAGGGGFSASGMPIYEVYPFIAQKLSQHIVSVPHDTALAQQFGPMGDMFTRPSFSKTDVELTSQS